jgi:hypothetical protein
MGQMVGDALTLFCLQKSLSDQQLSSISLSSSHLRLKLASQG